MGSAGETLQMGHMLISANVECKHTYWERDSDVQSPVSIRKDGEIETERGRQRDRERETERQRNRERETER